MGESRDTPTELAGPKGPDREPGHMVAGKYELVEMIARGGMGSVWKAIDTNLERDVAIKFMSPVIAHDAGARQRFAREAKAAAKLTTPHVVQIFEHGIDGESPYIVMELLRGRDLHRRLKKERRIPITEAAAIVKQIAKGLRAAHEADIIHRDLKPQNVFLANVDGDLVVKILDFGVAKMDEAGSESTKTGVLLGSPHYMSPEQARGKANIDSRSDVWSLAVIAFRMLTGKMAFHGEGQGDVIIAIATADIPVPSQVNPSLGPPIDRFFERALQRDREDRFATAVELATAFAEAVREQVEMGEAAPLAPRGANDEHRLEKTQQLPTPPGPRSPYVSYPTGPQMPSAPSPGTPIPHSGPSLNTPGPSLNTPGPSLNTPGPSLNTPGPSLNTPGPSLNLATPHSGALHTPATGPSIGVGPAIFSAPPEAQPQRKVVGLVVVVAVAMGCLAIIFAALGTGEDAATATEGATNAEEAANASPPSEETGETGETEETEDPAAPTPEPPPTEDPSATGSADADEPEPEPDASAQPSATASASAPAAPVPTPNTWKPKPRKDDWANPGY